MPFPGHRSAVQTSLVLAVILIALGTTLSSGGVPATQSIVDTALLRLADRDPAVREAARVQLMGLDATELPNLRRAVEAAEPLRPGQAEALHEIVEQIFLSGQNRDGDPDHGFIGILMNDFHPIHADDEDDSDQPLGVVVDGRVPGFAAYRMLRDGDIILGVVLDGMDAFRVHSSFDIIGVISRLPPGQRIGLQILRGGRRVEVVLILDPRPRELPPNQPQISFDSFRKEQDEKAEAYWSKNFAALVDGSIS